METTKTCRCNDSEHCQECCANVMCAHMADRETTRRLAGRAETGLYLSTRDAVATDIARGARY